MTTMVQLRWSMPLFGSLIQAYLGPIGHDRRPSPRPSPENPAETHPGQAPGQTPEGPPCTPLAHGCQGRLRRPRSGVNPLTAARFVQACSYGVADDALQPVVAVLKEIPETGPSQQKVSLPRAETRMPLYIDGTAITLPCWSNARYPRYR